MHFTTKKNPLKIIFFTNSHVLEAKTFPKIISKIHLHSSPFPKRNFRTYSQLLIAAHCAPNTSLSQARIKEAAIPLQTDNIFRNESTTSVHSFLLRSWKKGRAENAAKRRRELLRLFDLHVWVCFFRLEFVLQKANK